MAKMSAVILAWCIFHCVIYGLADWTHHLLSIERRPSSWSKSAPQRKFVVEKAFWKVHEVLFIVRDTKKWFEKLRFLSCVDTFPIETGSWVDAYKKADPFLKDPVCHSHAKPN